VARRRPRRVPEGPPWTIRRRIVVATLAFCAGIIAYLTGWGKDNELNRTIANGAWLLAGSTIGSYIFGSAWDSKNVMNFATQSVAEDDDASPPRPWRRRGPPGYAPADDDSPPPRGS
jgi:hypothetical protein